MEVNNNLSIDHKILANKLSFLDIESSALSIWAFLETSTKDLLIYFLNFKKISLHSFSKKTVDFFNVLIHSENQCSLSYETLKILTSDFNVMCDEQTWEIMKEIYWNRNEMAHTNFEIKFQLSTEIMEFIENFKKSVVKLL